MGETLSDIFDARGAGQGAGTVPVLHVVLCGNQPFNPPSQHVLADIDVVRFARGARDARRTTAGGLRQLAITIPDPRMSSDHGRLVHARGSWLLDDPASKNGAIVAGRHTRSAVVSPGAPFVLGHTVFRLDVVTVDPAAPRDLDGSALRPPLPELGTFHTGFQDSIATLARVAPTDLPALIVGETGTGKEVVARALHELSQRRGGFVAVNCGAIAATLIEPELFGHKKGAFSGATADRPGHLRSADRGTLFLDEIAELPLVAQAALLRALQEREVVPVGDSTPVAVDFRLCAATHRDLGAMVAAGSFREDLYARLLGVTVRVPPLRERPGDLALLVRSLLLRSPQGPRTRFTSAAALALASYGWPRNVRELERALAVAMAVAGGEVVDVVHLPEHVREAAAPPSAGATPAPTDSATPAPTAGAADLAAEASDPLSPEDAELRRQVVALLDETDGNVTEVARRLGKDRTQLYRWIRRFNIQRSRDD